jgi:hypothetical protein
MMNDEVTRRGLEEGKVRADRKKAELDDDIQ